MILKKLTESSPYVKLLLKGFPSAGKTYKAAWFPKPVFIDFDGNIRGLNRIPDSIKKSVSILNPYVDDSGKEITGLAWMKHFMSLVDQLSLCDEVSTIILDSNTKMQEHLKYQIAGGSTPAAMEERIKRDGFVFWGALKDNMAYLLDYLLNHKVKKHVVVIQHVANERDELTGTVRKELCLEGKITRVIEQKFTDNWLAYTKTVGTDTKYFVRTTGTENFNAKCTFNLPQDFEFDKESDNIIKQLS